MQVTSVDNMRAGVRECARGDVCERAGVVCRNVHIACVGRACGMCEVAYGVRVMCTLCGMHLSG